MNSRKEVRSIEKIAMPSRATFEKEFVEPCRPVVISGGMKKWRALSQWNEEFFRTSPVSKRPVQIEQYAAGDRYKFPIWEMRPMQEMPLGEYMNLVFSDRATEYYLADQDIDWILPELWGDIEYPDLFDRNNLVRTTFYLGRDTISAAHYHPDTQVVLCQVVGQKKFVFFPPEDTDKMYPLPWYSPNFNWSQLNFDVPDVYTRYPKLRDAHRLEVVLDPGDMIFVPVHWWHAVYGSALSVSVTYIWSARLREWPLPAPGLRTVAAALINNRVVSPLIPKRIRLGTEQAMR